LSDLKFGDTEQVCMVAPEEEEEVDLPMDTTVRGREQSAREERFVNQSLEALHVANSPVYGLVKEFADVLREESDGG